jgi:hypothetical protein
MMTRASSASWIWWAGFRPEVRILAAAASFVLVSLLLSQTTSTPAPESEAWLGASGIVQVLLACIALVVAGFAVARSPKSPATVGSAAFLSALAAAAIPGSLDTIRLAVLLLSAVASAAALLLLLPPLVRRLIISLLVVFHFAGIFCAVLSAAPPGNSPPWLTTQIWTRVFRPYLQFVYLNNAYHFYSPEPGPATLIWFRIELQDGSSRWDKIPSRDRAWDPLLVEYYRRLSLTENASQLSTDQSIPPEVAQRRAIAGLTDSIPGPEQISQAIPGIVQYRPLAPASRRFLESYVRHLARSSAAAGDGSAVRRVKVYRIVHSVPHPALLAQGASPGDHSFYLPFYQGAFDADGNLLDPTNAYLYWLIPILKTNPPALAASESLAGSRRGPELLRDYLTVHAGSSPWEANQ